MELYAQELLPTWTRLAATAAKGSSGSCPQPRPLPACGDGVSSRMEPAVYRSPVGGLARMREGQSNTERSRGAEGSAPELLTPASISVFRKPVWCGLSHKLRNDLRRVLSYGIMSMRPFCSTTIIITRQQKTVYRQYNGSMEGKQGKPDSSGATAGPGLRLLSLQGDSMKLCWMRRAAPAGCGRVLAAGWHCHCRTLRLRCL